MTQEMGETKIEPKAKDFWNSKTGGYAKIGDQVKGVLVRLDLDEFKGKPTQNYVLKSSEDGHEIILPNHALLNSQLIQIQMGRTVRIIYQGKSQKSTRGKNAPELYDVYMTSDSMQSVPNVPKKEEIDKPSDVSGKLIKILVDSTTGINDKDFWMYAQHLCGGNMSGAIATIQHLKEKGQIFQNTDGFWLVAK